MQGVLPPRASAPTIRVLVGMRSACWLGHTCSLDRVVHDSRPAGEALPGELGRTQQQGLWGHSLWLQTEYVYGGRTVAHQWNPAEVGR